MKTNESIVIEIDPGASTPIYMQIVEKLHSLMVAGQLDPGDRLPPVRKLAESLDINFNTVARAYRWLEEAGLLSMCQGRGTFVLNRPLAALERQEQQESLDHFTRRMIKDAQRLGFSPSDLLATLTQSVEIKSLQTAIKEEE
ncbi:MAG: GntR family transcriptional regulator [Anaerolineaceae bacterium]|nr:GntR family transcriptional regulator [Anaerolineaceae bacterium]